MEAQVGHIVISLLFFTFGEVKIKKLKTKMEKWKIKKKSLCRPPWDCVDNWWNLPQRYSIIMELHWLPVEQRIIFKINLICFKILNNLAPDYLVDLIHVYEPARYLRSSSDKWRLVIKPYNLKTYGFRAFSVIAPILWNDLPIDIRSIDNVNKFKSKLKTFLFKRVYELS